MYAYRDMTSVEQKQILQTRREQGFPLHAPPHSYGVAGEYLITTACYEHRHVFTQPEELSWLEAEMLEGLTEGDILLSAWVFLPNHYHLLITTEDLAALSEVLRLLYSRIATTINGRQNQRGRRVWYRYMDRKMRSERHRFASINYIHYNPVKHGYVERMRDWPWSSIQEYLESQGEEWLFETWRSYPLKGYGKGWDDG
jgi:putative transposase